MHRNAQTNGSAYPGYFLYGNGVADGVEPGSAILFGNLQAKIIQGAHLLDDFPGEAGIAVNFVADRSQFGLGEFANGFSNRLVFGARIKIQTDVSPVQVLFNSGYEYNWLSKEGLNVNVDFDADP